MTWRYVYDDLVIDILTRLPVKSLIRFKCVCKLWCATIRSSNFIAMHLNRSILDDNGYSLLVYLYGNVSCNFHLYSDASSLAEPPVTIDFGSDHQARGFNHLQLIGCCHGLVCLNEIQESILSDVDALNINIFLWNPSTRELRSLPKSSLDPPHRMAYMCYLGFGFDSKSNDYKIVKILHFVAEGDDVFYVEIYMLRTDSWIKINVFVPYFYNQEHQWKGYTYVNGAFHWPAIGANRNPDDRIMVSFDMGDETFQVTQMPPLPRQYFRLFPLKDSVALITDSHLGVRPWYFDLWVLKDFRTSNANKSWVHQRIRMESVPSPFLCLPLGFWKNGKFVLQVVHDAFNQPLVLYDHATKQFISLHCIPFPYDPEVHTFQESLVSVYGSISR